jgi:hypothetical protein
MAAGMLDVSKAALRLLLQQRRVLLPQQVARLAARLAEVGLSKELGQLAGSQGATITHLDEAAGGQPGPAPPWLAVAPVGAGWPPPWLGASTRPQTSCTRRASCGAARPVHCQPPPLLTPSPPPFATPHPTPAGLLAAALSGDLVGLQRGLQRGNSLALSALEANTYRLSSAQVGGNAPLCMGAACAAALRRNQGWGALLPR